MVNFEAETKAFDFTGQHVVVIGGSNGIGRGLARFYAAKGADVLILGRTLSAGQAALAELEAIVESNEAAQSNAAHAKQRVTLIQADVSIVKGMYKAAEDIKGWAGEKGVQYLYQCQGVWIGPPTIEGIEPCFAVQVLSRFAITQLLCEAGFLKEGSKAIIVGGAGRNGNARPIIDDLDFTKMASTSSVSLLVRVRQQTSTIDIYTKELSLRYPSIRFFHLHPGQVRSELIKRAEALPFIIRFIGEALMYIPGVSRSSDEYAPVAAYTVDIAAQNSDELCWAANGRTVPLSTPAAEEDVRKGVWQKLVEIMEAHK